jgi:ribonuclease III
VTPDVTPYPVERLEACQDALGYRFRKPELLIQALTHSSQSHEVSGSVPDNETLEFFGDAILEMLVTEHLFTSYMDRSEGELSKIRARVVRATTLARKARALGLGEFLLLGRGEERGGGRSKNSILADAFEAIVASVYLDGGLEEARRFVLAQLVDLIEHAVHASEPADFKSTLQAHSQKLLGVLPRYTLLSQQGPEHDKRFLVEVRAGETLRTEGWGRSKKQAEQEAARLCWEQLTQPQGAPAADTIGEDQPCGERPSSSLP